MVALVPAGFATGTGHHPWSARSLWQSCCGTAGTPGHGAPLLSLVVLGSESCRHGVVDLGPWGAGAMGCYGWVGVGFSSLRLVDFQKFLA